VKLCGMTRREDVVAAAALGADAIGFVVHPGSPRRISVADAARLGSGVDVDRYLVTVDMTPDDLIAAAERSGVTGLQPHGAHSVDAARAALAAGWKVLFPVPVDEAAPDLDRVPRGAVPILDRASRRHGGTGRAFDWALVEGVPGPWVLAGGLTPGTVAAAIAMVDPWGVDVASGVEQEPGVKDHEAMRRFVEAAR
jgi:phosphoribosylanthranilate isomerase